MGAFFWLDKRAHVGSFSKVEWSGNLVRGLQKINFCRIVERMDKIVSSQQSAVSSQQSAVSSQQSAVIVPF